MTQSIPKLLAPAGDAECLRAAVYAGAEEVYFGLSDFNARKGAKNFSLDEAEEAIRFCRLYGVKVHITLNTLLYKSEYKGVLDLVSALENRISPDAYIVQDLGLAVKLRTLFPGIVLHASTQLQVMGSYGNEILRKLGFSRVVLAREASLDDIKIASREGLETEIFVHGAMCVCRSGGCLMSSLIGKRSGNRGECAYPCRMEYNGKYALSLKDMCLARHIPEIIDSGVTLLKIEGRMKTPDYVYGVVSVYRKLLYENRPATDAEYKYLSDLFSRSGFTDGYFTRNIDRRMFGIRTESDKEKSKITTVQISEKQLPISLSADFGKDIASITAKYNDISVSASAPIRQDATNGGTPRETIEKQFSKLGGTHFCLHNIAFPTFTEGFYPVSALNKLRRDVIASLESEIIDRGNKELKDKRNADTHTFKTFSVTETEPDGIILRYEGNNANEINDALFGSAKRIEFMLHRKDMWKKYTEKYADKISLILPGFVFDTDRESVSAFIDDARCRGIKHLTLSNPTFIPLCEGFILHADFAANAVTADYANVLLSLGFNSVCASIEAKAVEWKNSERVIYGKIPLMNTRTCVICNVTECVKGHGLTLTDRTGAKFNVACGFNHANIIYNSVPVWIFDKCNHPSPVFVFTDESYKRQAEILLAYKSKSAPDTKFTRAYL